MPTQRGKTTGPDTHLRGRLAYALRITRMRRVGPGAPTRQHYSNVALSAGAIATGGRKTTSRIARVCAPILALTVVTHTPLFCTRLFAMLRRRPEDVVLVPALQDTLSKTLTCVRLQNVV